MQRCSLGILALCVACGPALKPASLAVQPGDVEFADTSPGEVSAEVPVRVSNPGGRPTDALQVALGGPDADDFAIVSDGCAGTVLAPAASCDVHLVFRPSGERQFAGELRIAAGSAAATLAVSGRAQGGARLSLSPPAHSFGGVDLGQSASAFVTVSNVGSRSSSPLSFDAAGDTGSFGVGGSCMGRTLAPAGSCDLQVTFEPRSLGAKALSLAVLASRNAAARASFDGYGKRVVHLLVSRSGDGQVAVGGSADSCTGQPCSVRFEIGGPLARASLTATPGAKSLFAGWSGACSGTRPSCDLVIDDDRSVVATFVPAVSVTLVAESLAGGSGVIGLDSGPSCEAPCRTSGLVPRGARIRLAATAGASSQFRWRDGCAGTAASCEATVTGDTTAIATFNGANYVFVTSQAYRTDLGLDGYDRACNERARIAGLPGPYLAWLSTAHADASSRFSSARGFIRVDGRPFTDTLDPRSSVYYPPALDEFGETSTPFPGAAMTGSDGYGRLVAGNNCSDWTVAGAYPLALGNALSGSGLWSGWGGTSCQTSWPIFCVGTGLRRPLQRERATGRIAFVSSTAVRSGGGLDAADSVCASEAAMAGLRGSFKALLAVDGASAASRFDLRGVPWVRPDGVSVVEKATDLEQGKLVAPIDIRSDSVDPFDGFPVWAGARTAGVPGTADSTCASWRAAAHGSYAPLGYSNSIDGEFWFGLGGVPCDGAYHVYCLQE